MIATAAPLPSLSTADAYYTPHRIDYWIDQWQTLTAHAEHIPSLHIRPIVSRNTIHDPHYHATIQADISRAHASLQPTSPAFRLVYLRINGYELRTAADLLHIRHASAVQHYHRALRDMAEYLGWKNTY